MKDRVARAMVEGAARSGRLEPRGTVVEYTAGTTGVSLALICAAAGYHAHFVFSDAFSAEKRRTMEAYGAELTIVRSDRKRITERLIKEMIAVAADISTKPGHWYCDQLNNRDGEAGYHALGEELWAQAGGRVDAFVQAVGTAHSIHGAADVLRARNPALRKSSPSSRRPSRPCSSGPPVRVPQHRRHRHRVPAAPVASRGGEHGILRGADRRSQGDGSAARP